MDKITKLRLLCLKWVFIFEGYGNYDTYSYHGKEVIEDFLKQETKHPDQWTDQDCIDFMTTIIEDGEQDKLHIPKAANGAAINGNVSGSASL